MCPARKRSLEQERVLYAGRGHLCVHCAEVRYGRRPDITLLPALRVNDGDGYQVGSLASVDSFRQAKTSLETECDVRWRGLALCRARAPESARRARPRGPVYAGRSWGA